MTAYAYAVLYDDSYGFLLAKKYDKGYFFGERINGQERGEIVPAGRPLNTPGVDALPGGGRKSTESVLHAASREFFEETNAMIPETSQNQFYEWKFPSANFGAGYFQVSRQELDRFVQEIETYYLAVGLEAREAIIAGKIKLGEYDLFRNRYPGAPLCDELQNVWTEQLDNPRMRRQIDKWTAKTKQDWFRLILQHLYIDILKGKW